MKTFLIYLTKDFPAGYDCNCSMVIVANTEQEARELANMASHGGDEHMNNPDCWLDSNITACREVSDNYAHVVLTSPTEVLG